MKKFSHKNTIYCAGVATLEMLMAMAIMVISISSVLLLVSGSQNASVSSQTGQEALYKAQDLLAQEKSLALQDFSLANPLPAPPAPFLQDGIYQKNVAVYMPNPWTKQLTATITWQNENGQNQNLDASTLITDPDGFLNGNDTCNSSASGNWKNPQIISYNFGKDLLVPSDTADLFPITDIKTGGQKLFAIVNNGHTNSNPTFFAFDISNPNAKPVFLTSIDNDPYSGSSAGLTALVIAGNYAYVGNGRQIDFSKACPGGDCGQLQIIDISSATPSVKTTFKIPGVTGKNGQAIASSIFYQNGYVYLGLAKTLSGPEFNIIDVHDPLNPVYKGGYSVGSAVNQIFVKNNIAYIATPNSENLIMINVADPTNPIPIGGYTPTGGSNGEAVAVIGTTAYLGRTFGTDEFYILNTTNPAGITALGSQDIGTGSTTSINGIIIKDYLAFLITGSKFEPWNIQNPAAITPWTTSGTTTDFLNLPGSTASIMGCNQDTLYVGSQDSASKQYISIINSGT